MTRSVMGEEQPPTHAHPFKLQTSNTQPFRNEKQLSCIPHPWDQLTSLQLEQEILNSLVMTHKIINSSATPIKYVRLLQTRSICTNLPNGENLDKNDVATDHSIKKP